MKKHVKWIIGIIILVVVVIIIVSINFPPVSKGLTSGSFGKADKYHQEQMTEADIQLRSEFTKDTAQLRQMITGLIYFAMFTDNLSMTIDTCLESYKIQGFDKDPANSQAIALLKDYNTFLRNNTNTLAGTTRMLAAFMLRDTSARSIDIEKNLSDFARYVNQINQKDSVLMLALSRVDGYLVGNKTLQKKTDEIRNLKAIRDQLVIKTVQFMALTGNKQGLGSALSYAAQSQARFEGIGALRMVGTRGKGELALVNFQPLCATLLSGNANLNLAFSATALQAAMAGAKINSASSMNYMVYDKVNLQLILCRSQELQRLCGAENLQGVLCGTNPNLGVVEIESRGKIGIVLNANVLCSFMNSASLLGKYSGMSLGSNFPARDLAAVNSSSVQSMVGINAVIPLGFDAKLQNLAGSNAGLNIFLKSLNSMNNGFAGLQKIALGIIWAR